MRETVKALTMGCKALAVGTFAIVVMMQGLANGTTAPGAPVVDGTLGDHWTHIPSDPWTPKGCWTGEAPKGVTMPGHVYAVFPDGTQEKRGPVWTGKALDSVFGKKPVKGLQVIAFCR